ncbi:hypothetical protein SELMODRAFT_408456 [Selaginella moellendorffii]|uniref:Membrane insertase YidC/Oxa/ALB C-terminal domain-containing protein n=1 Tax=Selaginella moellendorffii TaxID=88036 RepID=D8R8C9_SELML|nr:mitochondrial inner membrane protein OXA1 [Selaginella moellendorffii]EFJ32039.1 hypothetical protein SELMODRAFT_408456 [Selaginella moellendorffii]|eukprot:XP_002967440.1 mitochondrial inner membrane protein OXA1 [Selaginella moellendorffii]
MAARRALRKLGGGASSLFADCHTSHSSGQRSWSRFHEFAKADYHFAAHRDESSRRDQGHFPLDARSIAMFGNSRSLGKAVPAAGLGGGHSVRFCSSMSESAAESIRFPETLADAAQEIVSGAAGATYDLSKEIVLAVSESFPWTAAVQYVIYATHVVTGLPWWLSIALTTVAVRTMVLPLVIYQVKSTARFALLRPDLEKIKVDMEQANYDPVALAENKRKMAELFAKHKTDPFTPLIGALLQGPIFMCFFFGLRTMAEKMDSFKEGGAFWFTDLTTPDELFILPFITTATFLITVELNAVDGMQGQPNQKTMKNILRGMGVLFLPLTAQFPKALFCYWVTSNLWSMLQGALLRNKKFKAYLDIPDTSHLGTPAPPPTIASSKPPARKAITPPPGVSFNPGDSKKARRLVH